MSRSGFKSYRERGHRRVYVIPRSPLVETAVSAPETPEPEPEPETSAQFVDDGFFAAQGITVSSLTETTVIESGLPVQQTAIEFPAYAVRLGAAVRVAVHPGGTTTMTVSAANTGNMFSTGDVSTDLGATDPGTNGCPAYGGQADPVQFTFDTDPTDALGRITTTLFYYTIVP